MRITSSLFSASLLGSAAVLAGALTGTVFSDVEAHAAPSGNSYHLRNLNDAEDPLAFLEGAPSCDSVLLNIEKRYGKALKGQKLSAILFEEYRHVSKETCRSERFAACSFDWCAERVAKITSTEKADVIERVIVKDSTSSAASSLKAIAPTSPASTAKRPSSSAPTMSLSDAEAKLAILLKEKEQRIQQMVAAKRAEELKLGLNWKQFSVPGGAREPRARFKKPANSNEALEQLANVNGGRSDQIGAIDNHIAVPQRAPGNFQNPSSGSFATNTNINGIPTGAIPNGMRRPPVRGSGYQISTVDSVPVLGSRWGEAETRRVKDTSLTQAEFKYVESLNKAGDARARLGNAENK